MGDYYHGRITIPTRLLNSEIVDKIEEYELSSDEDSDSLTDTPLRTYHHDNARDGEFEELEDYLVGLGIPFDRYSSSYYEYAPRTRYFRPDVGADVTVLLTANDEEFIPMEDVRKLIAVIQDPEKLREDVLEAVEELLKDHGSAGIKPIEDYV